MEKQQVREKRIPVFTVLKKGAILKNIFVVKSLDLSSHGKDDAEVEEILLVGHHPDCDILLTLPSISRYHLQIRSLPSRQKLFLTDLSSVHGTWVADQKVEPDACVEVKEGDVIRIGGSTRIYSLHWIPLSRAYDIYVSPLHASTKNLEVAHQHQSQASAEDGDGHLDVTSEGSGSSVPSEDEDTYLSAKETSSLPVPRDNYIGTENLQITDEVQAESTSSGSLSLAHIDGCFEAADKENLTPNSHMLRRLREIKDTKSSSSKAMRKPFFDIHVEENLLAQQKPDVKCMSSNSKVKHEPVALKKKAERAPFQPILEKSSSQNQSYTEAPSTASARNNISRGVRSSSNLSDGKNKMRWTIVLDTSSLLDKDSRKTLHLLQGLKGTHLVIPRTVIKGTK
ncbi:BnaAnng02280D [Brassica napus]|uniref:BnaAnng02280D protein n=1 Tax=Brassica napus TaxID=3708 RepID=A0A078FIW3_BRANA|nr:BnaAnng02280D [Brassica napus]